MIAVMRLTQSLTFHYWRDSQFDKIRFAVPVAGEWISTPYKAVCVLDCFSIDL